MEKVTRLRRRKKENAESTESKLIFQVKRPVKTKPKMSRKYKDV
jgi:hypothetical protein